MERAKGEEEPEVTNDPDTQAVPMTPRARKPRGKKKRQAVARAKKGKTRVGGSSDYPRHALRKTLRIPRAILEQNAGRPCSDREAAGYSGVGYHGPFRVELSSAIKYGFLSRPEAGRVQLTDLGRKVLRPQEPGDELAGLREGLLTAPKIADVYKHYRGENIPDEPFFGNTLTETFGIPAEKQEEFKGIFLESLDDAKLVELRDQKQRVVDVSQGAGISKEAATSLPRLERSVVVQQGDSCFVMMPFAEPVGPYYSTIYEPAIQKAGLKAVRADNEIFATGKVIDQIWSGIQAAKVLLAELTGRNPNVFYELGLAHALQKPVVLVSSNQADVPFDVQHIRVIYYNVLDPFWGEKLISKVAENVLSAIQNPSEAILKRPPPA